MLRLKFKNKIKPILFGLFLIINGIPGKTMAQDINKPARPDFSRNSVYLEILGQGGIYSLNYDRLFSEYFGGRIGFSAFTSIFESSFLLVPITANYLVGSKNHHLELGAGVVFGSIDFNDSESDAKGSALIETATIGYRYQPKQDGFLFRIGFTPLIRLGSDGDFLPWGGLSVGYSF